jgi:guanylate kinase
VTPEEKRARRLQALAAANEIRAYRARLKVKLATGEVRLTEVLRRKDPLLETMTLRHLLLAVPHIGEKKVRRVLTSLQLSPTRTLGNLSSQRREEVIAKLMLGGRRLRVKI